jgi:putative ABC transport system permease protein
MGRTWTVLIVAQIAIAVAALPTALFFAWEAVRHGTASPGIAAETLLSGWLVLDSDASIGALPAQAGEEPAARYGALATHVAERLQADPAVAAVTFSSDLPGQEPTLRVEVEGSAAAGAGGVGGSARFTRVDDAFFDAFDVPLVAGGKLAAADVNAAGRAVLVNRAFVAELVREGGPAVGRRVRYVEGYRSGGIMRAPAGIELGEWYEIVGVVENFPSRPMEIGVTEARLYHPLAPGQASPAVLSMRVRSATPAAFAPHARRITAQVEPNLRLSNLRPLDEAMRQWQTGLRIGALALGLITLSVLLLSAAGIYALMSFTVAQRRREIGIRAALGANPRTLRLGIFSGAARQLGAGAAIGLVGAALLDHLAGGALTGGAGAVVRPAVALLMVGVGLVATLAPARRGLRIQPTEALKEG